MSYEKIVLVGNLGETPERRTGKDGQPVTSFSLAVNTKRGGQKVTTWYWVTAWNATAEHAVAYLKKGSQVLVEGSHLRVGAYLGKDGQPHASLELTADRVLFLDGAPEEETEQDLPLYNLNARGVWCKN